MAGEVSVRGIQGERRPDRSVALADMSPPLQHTLTKMKPGDITQPIRTAKGYQILKLETLDAVHACNRSIPCATWSPRRSTARGSGSRCAVPQPHSHPGDHRVEERGAEEGLRAADCAREERGRHALEHRYSGLDRSAGGDRGRSLVRRLDAVPPRAGRPGAAFPSRGLPGLPADDLAVEPLEGSQEAGRLAAVSRLLLRSASTAAERLPILKCTGRRQHRLVRRRHRA